MAGAMKAHAAQVRTASLAVVAVLSALLSGCVTTDELYADYDALLCPVEPAFAGALPAVAPPAPSTLNWPPAIYFAYDSSALGDVSRAELDDAIQVLTDWPATTLALTGFTSKLGSREYNLKLAGRRVSQVTGYLIEAGIAPQRIVTQPIGKGLPELSPHERVANAVNRRVGLTLLDEEGRPVRPLIRTDQAPTARPIDGPSALNRPR